MEISHEEHDVNFKGYQIVDCVVRSKKFFYFSLREDYTQWDHWKDGMEAPSEENLSRRIVCFSREKTSLKRWGHVELSGYRNLRSGISKLPKEQYVGIDLEGSVYVIGGGENEIEENVPTWESNGPNRGTISSCRTIDGYLYVTGLGRSVGYKTGKNTWSSLTQGIPYDYEKDQGKCGFEDIDGFNVNDIYCVGGKGDVWNFNGKKWQQIYFPSNLDLYTVCCAGDGHVYISGYGGTTFKGRGDKWKKIYKGQMAIPFKDMVWYEDKVWCTSDYGLWTIENEKLEIADVDDEVKIASGYLSTEDGVLLLAGYNGAAYKQDGKWHSLF